MSFILILMGSYLFKSAFNVIFPLLSKPTGLYYEGTVMSRSAHPNYEETRTGHFYFFAAGRNTFEAAVSGQHCCFLLL